MKIKTAEATGRVLEWLVASLEYPNDTPVREPSEFFVGTYEFTTDWAQGGPIIDREQIMFMADGMSGGIGAYLKRTGYGRPGHLWIGSTHLIAAMRCFVASKLGDGVDVPDELVS